MNAYTARFYSIAALLAVAGVAIAVTVFGEGSDDNSPAPLRVRIEAALTPIERQALDDAVRAAGYTELLPVASAGEADAELVPAADGIALDVWAVVTDPFSPVRDIPLAALVRLLAAPGATWTALDGPDVPIARLGSPWFAPAGRDATPAAFADVVREVSGTPGSLAVVPSIAVNASVRTLSIDGVGPFDGRAAVARYSLKRAVRLRGAGAPEPRLAQVEREFANRVELRLPEPIHLVALGTTLPARCAYARMRDLGDYTAAWRDTAAIVRAADIAIANLEAVPSDIARPIGCTPTFSFIAPAATTEGFAFAGLDIVSLANNHSRDYGPAALLDGIANLTNAGVAVVGAGPHRSAANAALYRTVRGVRFAFLAYDDVVGAPYGATDTVAGTNPYHEGRMTEAIAAARAQADAVIVMVQWGAEYRVDADRRQRAIAAAALSAGAVYVYGDGPHVPQGLEFAGDKLATYSLGNFIFDQDWCGWTSLGAILRLTWSGSRLVAFDLTPYEIADQHRPVPLTGIAADRIVEMMASATFRSPEAPPRAVC